jgi:DNA (cytosine-5)-methyltransferase 1
VSRPLLIDLYCGGGGAGRGYHDAGFEVVGVDLHPQPGYPYTFIRADALEFCARGGLDGFDGAHGSPPCPRFTVLQRRVETASTHVDHVAALRGHLMRWGGPYVIENVIGAPLKRPIMLCGSMFDLPVEKHRLFESNVPLDRSLRCRHARQARLWPDGFPALRAGRPGRARVVGVYGTGGGDTKDLDLWRWAMGIDWLDKKALSQAIPPAYTRWIGAQLLAHAPAPALP